MSHDLCLPAGAPEGGILPQLASQAARSLSEPRKVPSRCAAACSPESACPPQSRHLARLWPAWRSASAVAAAAAWPRSATCGGGGRDRQGRVRAGEDAQAAEPPASDSGATVARKRGAPAASSIRSSWPPMPPSTKHSGTLQAQLGGGPRGPPGVLAITCRGFHGFGCPAWGAGMLSPAPAGGGWLGARRGWGCREEGGEGEVDAADEPVGCAPSAAA